MEGQLGGLCDAGFDAGHLRGGDLGGQIDVEGLDHGVEDLGRVLAAVDEAALVKGGGQGGHGFLKPADPGELSPDRVEIRALDEAELALDRAELAVEEKENQVERADLEDLADKVLLHVPVVLVPLGLDHENEGRVGPDKLELGQPVGDVSCDPLVPQRSRVVLVLARVELCPRADQFGSMGDKLGGPEKVVVTAGIEGNGERVLDERSCDRDEVGRVVSVDPDGRSQLVVCLFCQCIQHERVAEEKAPRCKVLSLQRLERDDENGDRVVLFPSKRQRQIGKEKRRRHALHKRRRREHRVGGVCCFSNPLGKRRERGGRRWDRVCQQHVKSGRDDHVVCSTVVGECSSGCVWVGGCEWGDGWGRLVVVRPVRPSRLSRHLRLFTREEWVTVGSVGLGLGLGLGLGWAVGWQWVGWMGGMDEWMMIRMVMIIG